MCTGVCEHSSCCAGNSAPSLLLRRDMYGLMAAGACSGGRYVWTDGYWVDSRRGHHYIPGRWDHRRGGWVWVGGYWRR